MLQYTVQKMKFSITDFFSKCDQICSFLRIWSRLLKKSLMVGLIFSCSVKFCKNMLLKCFRFNSFIVKSLLHHRKSSEFVFYSPQIFVSNFCWLLRLFVHIFLHHFKQNFLESFYCIVLFLKKYYPYLISVCNWYQSHVCRVYNTRIYKNNFSILIKALTKGNCHQ